VTKIIKAYGDGRIWDDNQLQTTNKVIDTLIIDVQKEDLDRLRKDTLWLMDVLFPTGFSYKVNRFPSENVHGGLMEGDSK
jgi:hypothetical protein